MVLNKWAHTIVLQRWQNPELNKPVKTKVFWFHMIGATLKFIFNVKWSINSELSVLIFT